MALRSLLLLCGISGLLTGVWSSGGVVKVPCCPKHWVRLNDRCFRIVQEDRTFDDAELACQAIGGNLASILSSVEHAVILALVDMELGASQTAWIGFNDQATEATFVWTDGSPSPLPPAGFRAFEDVDAPNSAAEDCVVTNTGTDTLFWNDVDCTSTVPYVCVTDVH
ncbi:snaclec rhodocetin subunit delta [Syngnathus scovelli]|uniref:snaclec rhodocetin subunit delta n=1 Tax=Syngnathus scovelli TaxID=161590 RepID=UPI0021103539|nr:alpha-N-acetylgalactosamine-specific lectin [Syngnathus scovelli]